MTEPTSEQQEPGEATSAWTQRVTRIRKEQTLAVLETLGFDVDDINEMQRDALFLRKMRRATETTQAKVWAGAITLFFTLIGAGITLLVQNMTGTK